MRFEIFTTPLEREYPTFAEWTYGWYWRLRSSNGRIIADSSEAYTTKRGCVVAIHRIVGGILKLGHLPEIREVEW